MKFVLAFDSFKDCMRAHEVCACVREGVGAACPEAEVVSVPLADGGEGTVDAVCRIAGREPEMISGITGPLGEKRSVPVMIDGDFAVMEVASACGIELVPKSARDPLKTTTFGVGELLTALRARGVKKCVVGLGGSATVDGGVGMLRALGMKFYDADGRETDALVKVARMSPAPPFDMEILLASDVENPLCGERGAARVFGPQKGATPEVVELLSSALARFQKLRGAEDVPGDGAAGGLGFAFRMLGAKRTSGAAWLLDFAGFDRKIAGASLVITGEGRSDAQTADGKLPWIVAERAVRAGVPAALVSGALGAGYEALADRFVSLSSLAPGPLTLAECLQNAPEQLRRQGRNLASSASHFSMLRT